MPLHRPRGPRIGHLVSHPLPFCRRSHQCSPDITAENAIPDPLDVLTDQHREERLHQIDVVLVKQRQVPLTVYALRAVVVRHRRRQAVALVAVYRFLHVSPRAPGRILDAGIVAGGKDPAVVPDGVSDLRHLPQRHGMRPQVFDPVPRLRRLGDLLAQLIAVRPDHVLDVRATQPCEQRMDEVDVIRVRRKQVELPFEAGHAVVVRRHRLQTVTVIPLDRPLHVLHGVFPRIGGLPRRLFRLRIGGVVTRCEDQPGVPNHPCRLRLFHLGNRVGPQVFDPVSGLRRLGDLFTQFVPVRPDHVLDVGSDQVCKDRMNEVDVVRVHQEQVQRPVHALPAVIESDGGVQAFALVIRDGIVDIIHHHVRQILPQDGMAGAEDQPVMAQIVEAPRLFLAGNWAGRQPISP